MTFDGDERSPWDDQINRMKVNQIQSMFKAQNMNEMTSRYSLEECWESTVITNYLVLCLWSNYVAEQHKLWYWVYRASPAAPYLPLQEVQVLPGFLLLERPARSKHNMLSISAQPANLAMEWTCYEFGTAVLKIRVHIQSTLTYMLNDSQ